MLPILGPVPVPSVTNTRMRRWKGVQRPGDAMTPRALRIVVRYDWRRPHVISWQGLASVCSGRGVDKTAPAEGTEIGAGGCPALQISHIRRYAVSRLRVKRAVSKSGTVDRF